MTSDIDKALQRLRELAAQRHRATEIETEAIAEALRAGARQIDVIRAIDRSREHVRLAARNAGIESGRPERKHERGA